MYNRYIPGTNGIYQCQRVEEQKQDPPSATPPETPCPPQDLVPPDKACQSQFRETFDPGDLLLLCVVLLLMLDAEQEDLLPLLIAAAAFLILQ